MTVEPPLPPWPPPRKAVDMSYNYDPYYVMRHCRAAEAAAISKYFCFHPVPSYQEFQKKIYDANSDDDKPPVVYFGTSPAGGYDTDDWQMATLAEPSKEPTSEAPSMSPSLPLSSITQATSTPPALAPAAVDQPLITFAPRIRLPQVLEALLAAPSVLVGGCNFGPLAPRPLSADLEPNPGGGRLVGGTASGAQLLSSITNPQPFVPSPLSTDLDPNPSSGGITGCFDAGLRSHRDNSSLLARTLDFPRH